MVLEMTERYCGKSIVFCYLSLQQIHTKQKIGEG